MNRIREIRKSRGISGKELSNATGYSASYLYDIEAGRKRLNTDTINKLSEFFKVSSDYLMGLTDDKTINTSTSSNIIRLPIYDTISKTPIESNTNTFQHELFDSTLAQKEGKSISDYFYMCIKGDWMEPNLKEGDIVLIRQQKEVENGQLAAVIYGENEAQCRRVTIMENKVILNSDNPEYPPEIFNKRQCKIIGIVIALIRREY